MKNPIVGSAVHYSPVNLHHRDTTVYTLAAIVTKVGEDGETVGLHILGENAAHFAQEIKHATDDTPTPGFWNWPPKVT